MKNKKIQNVVDDRLRSLMAAALADPDVDPAAKSLAGYLLEYLSHETPKESHDIQHA